MKNSIKLWKRSIFSSCLAFLMLNNTAAQQSIDDSLKTSGLNLGNQNITNSFSDLKSGEFNKGNIQNPIQLIQGKVAGLSVTRPGSDPNGNFEVRLRGLRTINGYSTPLVVIDGVIGASIDNIDPTDIESISVLKDGSATVLYGARGSAGVILITTKNGTRGKTVMEYNGYSTVEKVARNAPAMTSAEWKALSKETGYGTDIGASTDWSGEIEQAAVSQVHNISISGGNDKTLYRASINYRSGEGVIINTGYSQINGRINITQKALNDRFTLNMGLGATERESKYGFSEAISYAAIYNPTAPVRSSLPAYAKYNGYFQQSLYNYYNPVAILELDKNDGRRRLIDLSLKGTLEICKGLAVDALYSSEIAGLNNDVYFDSRDNWQGMNRNGLASRQQDNSSATLFESAAIYSGKFTSGLNISALGGYSNQSFLNEGFNASGGNMITDQFSYNNLAAALDYFNGKGSMSSYRNTDKLIAYFGRVNLNLNNTWFITASANYEASPALDENNKWSLSSALGGGIDLSNLLNIKSVDNLKVRADYSVNRNRPDINYYIQATGLKPEKAGEFDAGVDFTLFSAKLSGSLDYYACTTTDLLSLTNVPVPPNLYNQALINLGKLTSSGLELSFNVNVIKKTDFTYCISFTPSYILENTIVSLSGDYNGTSFKFGSQQLGDLGSPGQNQTPLTLVQEGKPVGQIISYKFKEIDANGNYVFIDTNNDGKIDASDRVVTGNGLPKFLLGFGNSMVFKNWDFNIFFRIVAGYDLINTYRALYEVPGFMTSYNLPSSTTDLRNTSGKLVNTFSNTFTNLDVENASFISLDNMSLGYSFRVKGNSPFNKIRLYAAGNNLFYITGYKGTDPNPRYIDSADGSMIAGVDRMTTWPRTRSFTFGLNASF